MFLAHPVLRFLQILKRNPKIALGVIRLNGLIQEDEYCSFIYRYFVNFIELG
jgi:hypothetical protein